MQKRIFNAIISKDVFKINNSYSKAPKKVFFYTFFCVVICLIIFGFNFLDINWAKFFNSFSLFGEKLKKLVNWDFKNFLEKDNMGISFMNSALKSIWETISMAFAGSILGVLISIPFSIAAASNIVKNKFINNFSRFIIAIFRTIPSFTYALILVGYFGQTMATVTIAITIFSFSITSKFLFERIEHININIFISMQATGANKFRSFRSAVVPQISSHIISAAFYALETNIRYISVIAGVTGVGIGQLINNGVSYGRYDKVGFMLALLIVIIIFLEILIYIIKNYIIFDRDYLLDQKEQKKAIKIQNAIKKENNLRFYIKYILLKEWNSELSILKANKKTNLQQLREKKIEKNKIINKFKEEYKKNILKDKQKFVEYRKVHLNSRNWFIFNEELNNYVRMDKIYITKINLEVLNLKEKMISEIKDTAFSKHQEFKKTLTVEKVLKQKPLFFIKRMVMYLLILGLFAYSISLVKFRLENDATIASTNQHIKEIFNIDWTGLFKKHGNAPYSVIYLLIEGISISIIGTTLGAIFAYIFGVISSENIVNFYVAKFFVVINSAIRAIPSYIYAIIFISLVGMGPFTGALALMMGSIGMLSKYDREIFDDINMKLISQLQATGLNKWQRIKYGILPQSTSSIVSYIAYRFDINFKEVSVLGAVGASNMGYLLNSYFLQQYFSEFGTLLLGIMLVTILIEIISSTLRAKINLGVNPKWVDQIILWIKHHWFALYKANEKLKFKENNLSFDEAYAFYGYTNKTICQNAKEIKKTKKLSYKVSWLISYCNYFDIEFKNENFKDLKMLYKKHNELLKVNVNEFKKSRKEKIKFLISKKTEDKQKLKTYYSSEINKLETNYQKKEFKKEFRKNKNYINRNTKIAINSLNY
ncbi:PhnE/PtxC family ABC transporter permease [Spiroplasma tabanidicola]|uniref:Phosphonate transport system permease protein n=1 Tax=Spiroplasma tabanidicola TaxID=324079 RepID=A0A6I6CC32_9MOLU|nr:ABC transporter permease subunit [Spiroplasma tabanidicola]QGS51662.1 phosphonate transport system permease protein [Spiroplasma tabanidicola]